MKHLFTIGMTQEIILPTMSPSRILDHILNEVDYPKDYIYLIMGKTGPTGKTWLWDKLSRNGYNAREITEDIYRYVEYRGDENHYYINPGKKLVIIVLNKRLI